MTFAASEEGARLVRFGFHRRRDVRQDENNFTLLPRQVSVPVVEMPVVVVPAGLADVLTPGVLMPIVVMRVVVAGVVVMPVVARRRILCRLCILFGGLLAADQAARGGSENSVMSGVMPGDAANHRALDAAFGGGRGGEGQRR